MSDAMKAARQDVQKEAAHELIGIERHRLAPGAALGPMVLPTEGDDSLLVHRYKPPVGDGDAVRVAGTGRPAPRRVRRTVVWLCRQQKARQRFRGRACLSDSPCRTLAKVYLPSLHGARRRKTEGGSALALSVSGQLPIGSALQAWQGLRLLLAMPVEL